MTAAWLACGLSTTAQWPQPIAAYQVNSAGIDLSTLATPSFTPSAGELLVAKALGADASINFSTPTGGGWVYTARGNDGTASHTRVAMWTAPVTAGGTPQTVSVAATGTAQNHTIVVERWKACQLAPSPALTATLGSGAPSATNTCAGTKSAVTWCSGDWAAIDGTLTRVYRSEAQETGFRWLTGQYAGYAAYQLTTTAGAQTIGLTAPGGQTFTVLAVELQSTGAPGRPIPRLWQPVARAAFQ